MSENKYSFRNEIKFGMQKEKEERALKDFKRNRTGLYLSAFVFYIVLLSLGMSAVFIIMHQGLWDMMDYGILIILLGVVLFDIPRLIKAWKELK